MGKLKISEIKAMTDEQLIAEVFRYGRRSNYRTVKCDDESLQRVLKELETRYGINADKVYEITHQPILF